jgi:hypothetical protein
MTYSNSQLQLTHVLQSLYRRLDGKVMLITGGSDTTIIDTKLAEDLGDSNVDDIYNGGTAIVISDAGGAYAAPEGEFSRITDYVASTYTITISPALTTAVASGDKVLVTPNTFPLYDMIEVVNDALRYLGDVPRYDTSINTTAEQTEYTLPLALKGRKVINVELQTELSDANDNQWVQVSNWKEGFAAAGSTGTFILPQYEAGYTVRLTYLAEHPKVSAYADYIDEHMDRNLVNACVYVHALQWKNDSERINGSTDENLLALEQKAWSQLQLEQVRNGMSVPPRRFPGFPHW